MQTPCQTGGDLLGDDGGSFLRAGHLAHAVNVPGNLVLAKNIPPPRAPDQNDKPRKCGLALGQLWDDKQRVNTVSGWVQWRGPRAGYLPLIFHVDFAMGRTDRSQYASGATDNG